ncbi:MAG TPA: glycosyltransferase [Thermoanaerobaculia bacterium]|nr:glycosyltransferase [Thermoanaerobaculia bacterium]
MRVLRLIARLNVGGPAQHVVWLNEALAKEGIEALLVTGTVPAGEQDMSGFAMARGVTPVVLPSMSRELSPRDLVTIWQVWRLMRRFKPDIVHTHTAKAGAVGRIAGLLYGRGTFVHTYHGHVFHSYYGKWKTRVFLAIERFLARAGTDRIVVLSEQQRQEIHDRFRVGRREQFVVVPLGIDLDDVRAPELQHEGLVVGMVGRITAIKNHELFIKVAARCHDLARFVVYGDGEERAQLEARAPNVTFAGTKKASEIYASLDVVALTSRNEGTPLALIEAMACGKPVISTAVGGVLDLLGDIVEHHDGFDIRQRGITAASDDAVGFSAGLAHLLRNDSLRRALGERGRAYVESAHSKARFVADILDLYRRLLPRS